MANRSFIMLNSILVATATRIKFHMINGLFAVTEDGYDCFAT